MSRRSRLLGPQVVILALMVASRAPASAWPPESGSTGRGGGGGGVVSTATHPAITRALARLHEVLNDECITVLRKCDHEDEDRLRGNISDTVMALAEEGFGAASGGGGASGPAFPPRLALDACLRFVKHADSSSRRVDGLDVPAAVRGWPELGLAWGLLATMDHFARDCSRALASSASSSGSSSSGISSGGGAATATALQQCTAVSHAQPQALAWGWAGLVAAASGVCGVGYGVRKDGVTEFHARLQNELPLRRADLARRVLARALPRQLHAAQAQAPGGASGGVAGHMASDEHGRFGKS